MSERSELFTSMAEEIARNAESGFGGAFVLVPPEGDPKIGLFLGNACESSMFWATVRTLADTQIREFDAQMAQQNMFGNMR